MKTCPNCGNEMDETLAELNFCSECGDEFDEDDVLDGEDDNDSDRE